MKKTPYPSVFLKKDPKRPPVEASFAESIVNCLRNLKNAGSDEENEIYVNCHTFEKGLVLSGFQHIADIEKRILLRRPPFCPIKSLTVGSGLEDLTDETRRRGVNIGVAIILESSDHNILLTRRSKTMRTFPQVWVPPGGHMDYGETFHQSGMRELTEETGIQLKDVKDSMSILGLWESAFPPMRHLGLPKRHHVVVYLHHKVKETASQINEEIHLEANEVDACTWICNCVAQSIVTTDEQFRGNHETALNRCQSFPKACVKQRDYMFGILLNDDGSPKKGDVIPTAPLFAEVGDTSDNERVSTGTKYALKLWLGMAKNGS